MPRPPAIQKWPKSSKRGGRESDDLCTVFLIVLPLSAQRGGGPGSVKCSAGARVPPIGVEWLVAAAVCSAVPNAQNGIPTIYHASRHETHCDPNVIRKKGNSAMLSTRNKLQSLAIGRLLLTKMLWAGLLGVMQGTAVHAAAEPIKVAVGYSPTSILSLQALRRW